MIMSPMNIMTHNRFNRATTNRYVIDSQFFWREDLHPRVRDLVERYDLIRWVQAEIEHRIGQNVWGFPVDEQSISNITIVALYFVNDYLNSVLLRRMARRPEGGITLEDLTREYVYGIITVLWDILRQVLIENYPLVEDDLRHRTGKVQIEGEKETEHDYTSGNYTRAEKSSYHTSESQVEANTRNSSSHENAHDGTILSRDVASSTTTDQASTANTVANNQTFLSPQDKGVTPIYNTFEEQELGQLNAGAEYPRTTEDADFTTSTSDSQTGVSSRLQEGTTGTDKIGESVFRDREQEASRTESTDFQKAKENVNSQTGDQHKLYSEEQLESRARDRSFKERFEDLDMSGVLQEFFDIFDTRLMLELDNRLFPYYLHARISHNDDFRDNERFA